METLTSRHLRDRTKADGTKIVTPQLVETSGNRHEVRLEGTTGKRIASNGEVVYIQKKGDRGTMRQVCRQSSSSKGRNGRKTARRKNHLAFRCDIAAAKEAARLAPVRLTPREAWDLLF